MEDDLKVRLKDYGIKFGVLANVDIIQSKVCVTVFIIYYFYYLFLANY